MLEDTTQTDLQHSRAFQCPSVYLQKWTENLTMEFAVNKPQVYDMKHPWSLMALLEISSILLRVKSLVPDNAREIRL